MIFIFGKKRAENSLVKYFSSRLGGQTLGTEEPKGASSWLTAEGANRPGRKTGDAQRSFYFPKGRCILPIWISYLAWISDDSHR